MYVCIHVCGGGGVRAVMMQMWMILDTWCVCVYCKYVCMYIHSVCVMMCVYCIDVCMYIQ